MNWQRVNANASWSNGLRKKYDFYLLDFRIFFHVEMNRTFTRLASRRTPPTARLHTSHNHRSSLELFIRFAFHVNFCIHFGFWFFDMCVSWADDVGGSWLPRLLIKQWATLSQFSFVTKILHSFFRHAPHTIADRSQTDRRAVIRY